MEAAKTRALLKKVRDYYPAAFVYKVNDRTRSGIPDAVLCLDGEHVWVEFKELRIADVPTDAQVKKAVTEIQRLTIHRMVLANVNVLVVVFVGSKHFVFRYSSASQDFFKAPYDSLFHHLAELWTWR